MPFKIAITPVKMYCYDSMGFLDFSIIQLWHLVNSKPEGSGWFSYSG